MNRDALLRDVKPVVSFCKACDAGIQRRGVLAFRRVYLCESHAAVWDEQDKRDLERTERGQR